MALAPQHVQRRNQVIRYLTCGVTIVRRDIPTILRKDMIGDLHPGNTPRPNLFMIGRKRQMCVLMAIVPSVTRT